MHRPTIECGTNRPKGACILATKPIVRYERANCVYDRSGRKLQARGLKDG